MTYLNDEAVYRTAPATPGLLNMSRKTVLSSDENIVANGSEKK